MNESTLKRKTLIVIVGPTASGKTAMAVDLALKLKTEVISADSRQFFKKMSIGTAKPSSEELKGVPHHFLDFLELDEAMNAGAFEQRTLELLEKLFQDHDQIIMTGGSGLYIDAVCYGLDEMPTTDPEVRADLNRILENDGLDALLEELKGKDPITFEKIEKKNPHRVMRALEVFRSTGRSITEQQKGEVAERPFNIKIFGIEQERELLYERINARVDRMMEDGLLEEVRALLPYRKLNALNTVGYKELFDHLDGNSTLEEAVDLIKQNTRRYAKRQMTWWRKNEEIEWLGANDSASILKLINPS